jgi:hypothetical protein
MTPSSQGRRSTIHGSAFRCSRSILSNSELSQ